MVEPSGRARTLLLAIAASAAVVAVAVLFFNVTSTARVTDHALELHRANSILGTAALARAAASQAALFDDLADRGLASMEEAKAAEQELAETTSALRDLAGGAPPIAPTELEALLGALAEEPLEQGAIDEQYGATADLLRDRIAFLEAEIERTERLGSYASGAIRLLVALIIPAAVIRIYRKRASEQVKTERLKMEAQLEAEREIGRAKDRFVAGMSHEIRTPLTGICGFSEMLLDAPPDSPLDRETVGIIHSEASDLGRMVDDFIATSRIEGQSLEVDAVEVPIREVAESVAARFGRLGASVAVEGSDPVACCDRARTVQILTNLVSNAVHHGGPTVSITLEADGSKARCHVSDDGAGIPSDMEDRLFTRFVYDGDEALTTGSLGLGTWVARELARAMGGDVVFRTEPDLTVFTLSLPNAEPSHESLQEPVEAGAAA